MNYLHKRKRRAMPAAANRVFCTHCRLSHPSTLSGVTALTTGVQYFWL